MRSEAEGSSEVTTVDVMPEPAAQQVGDALRMVLVDGDDQAARIRLDPTCLRQAVDRLAQHRRAATRRRVDRAVRRRWLASELVSGSSKVAS